MMNPSPPELFADRPIRSDFGRGPSYRVRRIITVSVVALLIAFGLYFAFGHKNRAPGEIPVLTAEGPYKQKPQQPGGIDIPHQDVEIYQAIGGGKGGANPSVEHLLPLPETPKPVSPSAVAANTPSAPPQNLVPTVDAPPPAPAPIATTVSPQANAAPKPVITQAQSAPLPKSVSASSGKAGAIIQLASVTDPAAAQSMTEKLQAEYASYLGGTSLHVVKADLGDKGVFYRIQSKPISSDLANQICRALKNHNAGCLIARH